MEKIVHENLLKSTSTKITNYSESLQRLKRVFDKLKAFHDRERTRDQKSIEDQKQTDGFEIEDRIIASQEKIVKELGELDQELFDKMLLELNKFDKESYDLFLGKTKEKEEHVKEVTTKVDPKPTASKEEKITKADEGILDELKKLKKTENLSESLLKDLGFQTKLGKSQFEIVVGKYTLKKSVMWGQKYNLRWD